MFRHRNRPATFINWTDYRWEPNTWQGATGPRPWTGRAASPRSHSFLQIFLAGLAVVAGVKLISALRSSSALRTILLLLVASCVSKQRRR